MVQLFPLVHQYYIIAISFSLSSSGYVTNNILSKDKKSPPLFIPPCNQWWPPPLPSFSLFFEGTMVFHILCICSQILLSFLWVFLLTPISTSQLAFTFSSLIPVLSLMIIPRLHIFASALSSFIPLGLKWLATKYFLYSSIPRWNHIHVMFWVGKEVLICYMLS